MKSQLFRQSLVAGALLLTLTQGALPQIAAASTTQHSVVSASTSVTVIVDALNVRSGPSLQADIIGSLTNGTQVSTLGQSADGAWWKISYGGKEAYIFAQYAVSGGSAVSTPSATSPGSVTVTSEYLNVRAGPGLDQTIIGKLANGDNVKPCKSTSKSISCE